MQQAFAREQTGGHLWDHRVSVLWTRAVAVGVMSLDEIPRYKRA